MANENRFPGDPYPFSECTWWVWGRVNEETGADLGGLGNAMNWYNNVTALKGYNVSPSIYDASPGDILCWDKRTNDDGSITVGHVQYVESVSATHVHITESYAALNGASAEFDIEKSNPRYGKTPFPWEGVILIGHGGGGSGDDEEGEGGTRIVPVVVDIRESECGKGVAADQTGSQDEPKAPYQMDGNPDGTRQNERWEPFNMYTYERTLTYDQNNNPVWSSWEQKYSGSQTRSHRIIILIIC